jgi:hypothetical protein
MAIVRRAVGRASVPGAPVSTDAPPLPQPPIPHQPTATGLDVAAAAPTMPAKSWAVLAGFGLAGLGGAGAWSVNQMAQPAVFHVDSPISVFAALFVFAAAVERLIEPISRWMPGRGAQALYERALADTDNGVPGAIQAAAQYKAAADQARSSRAVIMWGLATLIATLLSAGAGFYLLRMINVDPQWDGVSTWIDALVTGLVVGSGTKPLHDLFQRFQQLST